MENRVAILGILIENESSAEAVNTLLHEFGNWIVGRMGIPYRARKLNIISVVLDAPQDTINSLAGKLGRLPGVTARAVTTK